MPESPTSTSHDHLQTDSQVDPIISNWQASSTTWTMPFRMVWNGLIAEKSSRG